MTAEEKIRFEELMRRCIELGRIAKERGDNPVGAVLAIDGESIAEGIEAGRTKADITCHAEVEAIREALRAGRGSDLSNCVLVTTHEPCILCSYVIRHHSIGVVVFAIATGEIGGVSSRMPVLADTTVTRWGPPPLIIDGVLTTECKAALT
ncbi:MAG: nucleoside deaminase [Pyrinomonadaceae bacterium]